MAAIHNEVFESVAQTHKADDIALHGFMEQLLAGEYDVSGTSPDLGVQVSTDIDIGVLFQAETAPLSHCAYHMPYIATMTQA